MILPSAFDFLKKKFLKPGEDTPEATISTLATTKPEILPLYVDAMSKLFQAKKDYHNRDVVGDPSRWVIDLRSSIIPVTVLFFMATIISGHAFHWTISQEYRELMESCVGLWFGTTVRGYRKK